MEEIYIFEEELSRSDLIDYFSNPKKFNLLKQDYFADLQSLDKILKYKKRSTKEKINASKWDSELVKDIHKTFSHINNRLLTDIRFLQWLSVAKYPFYVWNRWMTQKQINKYKGIPNNSKDKIDVLNETGKEGLSFRFLGSKSTKGLASRHTFGRMIFAGEILSENENYEIAQDLFINQNCPHNLFERDFGLHKETGKTFVKKLCRETKEKIEIESKKLNHYATTVSIENIDSDILEKYLS